MRAQYGVVEAFASNTLQEHYQLTMHKRTQIWAASNDQKSLCPKPGPHCCQMAGLEKLLVSNVFVSGLNKYYCVIHIKYRSPKESNNLAWTIVSPPNRVGPLQMIAKPHAK